MKKGVYDINGSFTENWYDRLDFLQSISRGTTLKFVAAHPNDAVNVSIVFHSLTKLDARGRQEKCALCFSFYGRIAKIEGKPVKAKQEVILNYCCGIHEGKLQVT